MKLAIFGIGGYYKENKKRLFSIMESTDEISFFVDNRTREEDVFEGKPLYPPEHSIMLDFDMMLIMSIDHFASMKAQINGMGICEQKIYPFWKFVAKKSRGEMHLYKKSNVWPTGKRILIIVPELDYHGAPIAALSAERILSANGYDVCIAAPKGNPLFIKEIVGNGITVLVIPSLPYVEKEELYWIRMYDAVVVNTFPMILAAFRIAVHKPVLWWIHEGSEKYTNVYGNTLHLFSEDMVGQWEKNNISTYAVSEIARRNFMACYPDMNIGIMSYGIPDAASASATMQSSGKMVFAIIGNIYPLKGQSLFLQAIREMEERERAHAQFWIIGHMANSEYGREIRKQAASIPEVKIMGVLTRAEMALAYPKIHVVVCPSLEDALPLVVVEGMMYGKVCIVSDAVGQAKIIKDKENGLVCQAGNWHSLLNKMQWILTHQHLLEPIGKASRMLYDNYFSMEKFGERIEKEILDICRFTTFSK